MQREVVFYSGGERLVGNLHLPPEAESPVPGLVLCTGFGGVKDLVLPQFCESFAQSGFAVLRFDHRGFGGSGGPKWHLIPMEQVTDIRNAVTFMSAQAEVDPARIGLFGTSFGGGNAIVAAAVDDRVRALVACVAVGNGHEWMRSLRRNWEWIEFQRRVDRNRTERVLTGDQTWVDSDVIMPPDPDSHAWHLQIIEQFPERRYELPLETAEAIFEFRPEEFVGRISPRPILLIAVTDDQLVPNDQTARLFDRAGQPKRLIMLEGITHHAVYAGEPFRQVVGSAVEWFDTHLRG